MTLQEQLVKIEAIARERFRGIYRRDGITPYIKHVEDVASRVHSIEEKIVAWGHDLIEDTKTTAEELLEMGFSKHLVEAIVLLTKVEGYDLQKYLEAIKRNPLARAVKLADMRSNLADTPTKNQIKRYSDGILYLTT